MAIDLVVSHYRVIEALGAGGMGEVYLAQDETLKRKVALKAIRADHRLNPTTRARFIREAQVLSQLDHPNICRVYDYIETPDTDWIVLELIEGQTLRTAMRRHLTLQQKLGIARQIADVLVATHAAGVVHRDLKPGNVMLTPGGDVKVLDFGLSATVSRRDRAHATGAAMVPNLDAIPGTTLEETRLIEPASARGVDVSHFQSQQGAILGTVVYMSPEQARGEIATSASDMYSYGLVIQELFSGQPAYDESLDGATALAKAQRGESLPPTGMHASIRSLIERLKAHAPAQRPTALDTQERWRWIVDRPRRVRRNLMIAALVIAALAGAARYTTDLSRERNAAVAARKEADQRRGQAEGLIGFMVGDLRTKLAAVGRLEILDDVGKQALAYFGSVPADTLTEEELFRRSQALHQLGQVRQARADPAGALAAYEESLVQATEVVRRQPDNAEWQLGLGTSHFYVGDLKMRRGELAAALAHFQAYKEIAERLVARDATNFEWKLELSYGHSNVAAIYSRQGNLRGAREQLERTAALQAGLATQRPSDLTLKTSRANNFNRLGIVQEGLGDLEAAAASFANEMKVYDEILAIDARDTRVRRRRDVSHIFRGRVLRALGRTAGAASHLDSALREAEALVALDLTNANWRRDLGVAQLHAARLDLDQGRTQRALSRYRSSYASLLALAQNSPG
ncbi:MAG: serine/threonine-protein kinase, partial [Vicinamibacterales bacterium]